MCGIVGFIGGGNEIYLKRMLESISHRGPDGSGFLVSNDISMAHARLSILDVSENGKQPMLNNDRDVAIVFNGEIYNYLQLRNNLISKGYIFRGTSDTEVIIYLYKEFGDKSFKMIEGMFSIGLYDFNLKKLFLVRDRIGKKPLYYFVYDGGIAFASELKALVLHPLFKKEIDLESLSYYLFYDYVPTNKTIYKNVYKLEPATVLCFYGGNIEKNKIWNINVDNFKGTFSDAKKQLDYLINKSVKDRLISDVPLGVFLSGGLDSSIIAYYAQKNSLHKIKTFSIGFEDKSFDESEFAIKVAHYLGTDHHHKKIYSSDIIDFLHNCTDIFDEPFADASVIPTYFLSQFAKKNVTVALGGDGGDELFAGYPTFQADRIVSFYRIIPSSLRQILGKIINKLPTRYSNFNIKYKLQKFIEVGSYDNLIETHQKWLSTFDKVEQEKLLNKSIFESIKSINLFDHVKRYEREFIGSVENKNLYVYLRTYLLDLVMVKVDRASMYASLEARSPFLDHKLVEFAYSLPYKWKLRGLTTKYILKEIMKNNLPDRIIYRQKKGFGLPIGAWFRNELMPLVDSILSEENIKNGGFFDYRYVKILKEDHFSGKTDNRKKLWNLVVFELWRKKNFIKK